MEGGARQAPGVVIVPFEMKCGVAALNDDNNT